MKECRDILWDWENIHVGSNPYTSNFVWARAALTNDPEALLVKQWMKEVFLRYEAAGYDPSSTLIDEFVMQHSLGFETIDQDRIVEDLSTLVSMDGCMMDAFAKMPEMRDMKPLLRAAITLAMAREANTAASVLLSATQMPEGTATRTRL